MRVDRRELSGDVLHHGYEELLKGACSLDPQLERKREEGMTLRWGRELFRPEYSGLGLAMSKASKLLKVTSAFDRLWDHAALVLTSRCG